MTLVLLESDKPGGGGIYNKMQEISSLQCNDLHVLRDLPRGQQHPGAVQAEQPCLLQSWSRQQAMRWPWRWALLLHASSGLEMRSIWAPKP